MREPGGSSALLLKDHVDEMAYLAPSFHLGQIESDRELLLDLKNDRHVGNGIPTGHMVGVEIFG